MKELIHHTGRFSIVYSDYVEITGDACSAQLLSSIEYWTKCKLSVIEEIEKQNAEAARNNSPLLPVPELWLYEKIQDFVDSLCGTFKRTKILEALKLLKEKGFVESKPSPNPWDKTCFWRMNIEKVKKALKSNQDNGFDPGKTKSPRVRIQTIDNSDLELEGSDLDLAESPNSDLERSDSGLVERSDSDSHPYMILDPDIIQDQNSKTPLTPQGEPERGGNRETLIFSQEEPKPEPATIAPSPQADSKPTHLPTQKITPEINHPAAVENDSRFLPSDPTAENMTTWNAIAATGAMKGASHPDPEFLEFYRQILSKCSHYKGQNCTANHAKAALKKLWQQQPLKLLGDAENWVASKAKFAKSTQARNVKDLSEEEKMAVLQRVIDRRKNQETKGA